jgi:hypothetical protein
MYALISMILSGIKTEFFQKLFYFRFHQIVQVVVKVEAMKSRRRRNLNFEHHHFFENVKKKKKLQLRIKLKNKPFDFSRYYLVLSCCSFFCRKFFCDTHFVYNTLTFFLFLLFILYVCSSALCVCLLRLIFAMISNEK